jgi:hypothetical protein
LAERSPGFVPFEEFERRRRTAVMSPLQRHPLFAFTWTSEYLPRLSRAVLVKLTRHDLGASPKKSA